MKPDDREAKQILENMQDDIRRMEAQIVRDIQNAKSYCEGFGLAFDVEIERIETTSAYRVAPSFAFSVKIKTSL